MSTFNPDTFLSMETRDGLQTKYMPIPSGEYKAFVDGVEARTVKGQNGDSPVLTVTFEIRDADAVKKQMGMREDQKMTVRNDYWLDLNESGGFDIGPNKNVKLGILRDALGQNRPGEPWSPMMMNGQGPLLIQLGIDTSKKDAEVEYNVVKRVTKYLG